MLFMFVNQCPIPSKMVMSPKIIYHGYIGKYCGFFQTKNIQNFIYYKKGYIDNCHQISIVKKIDTDR